MPTFKFRLNSEIEVEAPTKAEAMKLVGSETHYALDRIAEEARYVSKRPTNTTEWIDTIIRPLAKKVQKKFPGFEAKVQGPCGLDCNTFLVLENGNPEECMILTFTPGLNFSLLVKDYSRNLNHFREGTIGEINGMNYPCIDVPKNGRVDWIVSRLKATKGAV